MARIKIALPNTFSFKTEIPVRITDLNYGGHVGNDTILSMLHEARVQFLTEFGYTELNLDGIGLIMSDVAIEFKNELFYGETITASVTATEFTKISFELYYKLEKKSADNPILVATAKTTMVCFDYEKRKLVPMPSSVREKLTASG